MVVANGTVTAADFEMVVEVSLSTMETGMNTCCYVLVGDDLHSSPAMSLFERTETCEINDTCDDVDV